MKVGRNATRFKSSRYYTLVCKSQEPETVDNQSGLNIKIKFFNLGIIEHMELLIVNVIDKQTVPNSTRYHYNRQTLTKKHLRTKQRRNAITVLHIRDKGQGHA